jgi:hypothetical protein
MKRIKVCYIYTYEDNIRKPTKLCWKSGEKRGGEWKYKGWGELVQGVLYACMELSQSNPLILLMYAN